MSTGHRVRLWVERCHVDQISTHKGMTIVFHVSLFYGVCRSLSLSRFQRSVVKFTPSHCIEIYIRPEQALSMEIHRRRDRTQAMRFSTGQENTQSRTTCCSSAPLPELLEPLSVKAQAVELM